MNVALKYIIATAAVAAALALGSSANAQDWKVIGQAEFFAVGIGKDHVFWVGEYSGAFFNDKGEGRLFNLAGGKRPASNYLDTVAKKGKESGYCIISDSAGDQAYLSFQGKNDGPTGHGTFEYTGGTGKYQGITGQNTFTGHLLVNCQDGTSSGYATWNF